MASTFDVRKFDVEKFDGILARGLGLAQLGSLGVVDDKEFAKRMAEKTTRVLIPRLFRELFDGNEALLKAAEKCEREGTGQAAREARDAAAAADAAAKKKGTSPKDTYLLLAASLALETLRELKSPGCELLEVG